MNDKPQLDKFKELARDLKADEDKARFEEIAPKPASPPDGKDPR